jgi:hypothetical protein
MRSDSAPLRERVLPALASLAIAVILLGTVLPAEADVLVREKTSSSGIMGMGASEGQSTVIVSGDKQQTEREMTIQGMPAGMGGDGPMVSVDIVRLDRDLIWHLDMSKKEYTEMTFEDMKQMMKGAKAEWSKHSGTDMKTEDIDFSVEVETPGAKKKINGFATERKILRITGEVPKAESGGTAGEFTITADMWVAEDVPGYEELRTFQKAFAKKMGIDPSMFQGGGGVAQMMGGSMGKLTEEMQKIEGYPILMEMTMEIPGAAAGMPAGMEKIDMNAMLEAAKSGDMEALEKMQADMEKQAEQMESDPSAGAATMTLTVRHEVVEITTTEVPKVGFGIPEGFTKVEREMPFQMQSE